jgi:ornithine cyclodeaminase
MKILTDADLDRQEFMAIAIDAVTESFRLKSRGDFVAPPRLSVPFADKGSLVFTIGGSISNEPVAGFRVYDTFHGERHEQLVTVWRMETAELIGIVTGERLGAIRTGAIGGVAIRHMSNPDARRVGVLGSGHQARTQLEAAAAVRKLEHIRVFSRSDESRRAFALEMSERLQVPVEPVASAQMAVEEADIVLCATSSTVPVIEAAWLKPGAHINTVGPKTIAAHEIGLDIATRAGIIATDSPEQMNAYDKPFFLAGSPSESLVCDLAQIACGNIPGRRTSEE